MNGNDGCAMLAGGAGRRMGHINKADLKWKGSTFSERIRREMEKTGCPCYISAAEYELFVPESWTLVNDPEWKPAGGGNVPDEGNHIHIGPVGGIYSCLLKAREDGLRGLFFVPCDAPLYRAELAEKLAKYIREDTEAVCWRTGDKKIQPAFGWYSVSCIPVFEETIRDGKYKMMKILERFRLTLVETNEEGVDDRLFLNVNLPADYERLSSLPG